MSSEEDQPRGILRNAQTHDYSSPALSEYDRKLVLENTKKNAELFKFASTEGDKIRNEIAKKKRLHYDNVQFNRENLAENDKLKASMTFTKIDEPKTPYQGPINENNDYYREDEDEEGLNFSLGEGEDDIEAAGDEGLESLHGSKIIPADEVVKAKREKDESELSPEELKHKKFEEMRKKHYRNEVVHPLKNKNLLDEEEEEELQE